MKVMLISHTPDPERLVAAAARVCYSTQGAEALFHRLEEDEVKRLIHHLLALGHESPFEHITFTFALEGVSRVLSHQLVRHRMASYSQRSQRFVDEGDFGYIIPPSIRAIPEAFKTYVEGMDFLRQAYQKLKSLGVPLEDARYLLPSGVETSLVCTFNARSLFNFFRLRCCQRAQWEIRELASKMREEVRGVAPNVFRYAGPPCEVEGVCYEGEKSCGRAPVVRRRIP